MWCVGNVTARGAGRRLGEVGAFALAMRGCMISTLASWRTWARPIPAPRRTLITRSDVVSRGAVVGLPALDPSWFDSGGRPIALILGLAVIALVSLIVAAAAHAREHRSRKRSRHDESELFTTTPLPMAKEDLARMRAEVRADRRRASDPRGLPRWVQLGTLIIACAITYATSQRLRTDDSLTARTPASTRTRDVPVADGSGEPVDESPENIDPTSASAPPFAFRARDFVAMSGGCTGKLEVTRGVSTAWTLTARVHDDRGQLLDTARAHVDLLRSGDVLEFRFRRTPCDQIGAWDVQGARR